MRSLFKLASAADLATPSTRSSSITTQEDAPPPYAFATHQSFREKIAEHTKQSNLPPSYLSNHFDAQINKRRCNFKLFNIAQITPQHRKPLTDVANILNDKDKISLPPYSPSPPEESIFFSAKDHQKIEAIFSEYGVKTASQEKLKKWIESGLNRSSLQTMRQEVTDLLQLTGKATSLTDDAKDLSPIQQGATQLQNALDQALLSWRFHEKRVDLLAKGLSLEDIEKEMAEEAEFGGLIMVDLDEAIHGIYAAIDYLVKALNGGAAAIGHILQEGATLAAKNPIEFFKEMGYSHGLGDVVASTVTSTVLFGLSFLAINAGIEEMGHAKKHKKELKDSIAKTQAKIDFIQKLQTRAKELAKIDPALPLSKNDQKFLQTMQLIQMQVLSDLKRSKKQTHNGGMVGLFSLLSGGFIALKSALGMSAKIAHFATSASGGATAFAGGVGLVSTLGGLSVFAALSAVGLGAYMLKSSINSKNRAIKDHASTSAHLKKILENADPKSQQELRRYINDFYDPKMTQRTKFLKNFSWQNGGFLVGSNLYLTGAVMTLLLPAIAHPATLGASIALGAFGGLTMALYSRQFLTGHGRHHRYEGYEHTNDLELDRTFLSQVDALNSTQPDADPLLGLKLRAQFEEQIYQEEDLRQDFLIQVAKDTGLRFDGKYIYTNDTAETRLKRSDIPGKLGQKNTKWQVIKKEAKKTFIENASLRTQALGSFGKALALPQARRQFTPTDDSSHSIFKSAKAAAQKTWNDHRPYITATHLAHHLSTPKAQTQNRDLIKSTLDLKIKTLGEKLPAKIATYALYKQQIEAMENTFKTIERIYTSETKSAALDETLKSMRQSLADQMLELDKALEIDQLRYAQLLKILGQLDTALLPHTLQANDAPLMAKQARFLNQCTVLMQGKCFDPEADSDEKLKGNEYQALADARKKHAEHLLKQAPALYRDRRGGLITTENQASRIREQLQTQMNLKPVLMN